MPPATVSIDDDVIGILASVKKPWPRQRKNRSLDKGIGNFNASIQMCGKKKIKPNIKLMNFEELYTENKRTN